MSAPLLPTSDQPIDAGILYAAIDASSPDNVSSSVQFLVARCLNSSDPAQCYAPDLIRALAACDSKTQRDVARKLKQRYGKDLNLNQFNADIKQARSELIKAQPSNLIVSESGAVKPLLANAITLLRQTPDLKLGYDTFSSRVTVLNTSPWGTEGSWTDLDDLSAANHLQHQGVAVRPDVTNEAAQYLSHQNEFHPVRDWLNGLRWDGEPRLDDWVINCLGSEETPIMRAFAAKWMISAVARIMRPGCLAKYMIVLEGAQDKGKSKALRALVNGHLDGDSGVQWFRDNMPDIDHDDIGLYIQGVWIVEVAELSAIRGKQWERTKSFISSPRDSFRRKFGRNLQDYPRQCVFAGTTNEEHWAGDATGNTRFWPIATGEIDCDRILRDRDHLWAEARFRYDEGELWWLDDATEEQARDLQAQRTPDDPWTQRVLTAVAMQDDVSIQEILSSMGISTEKQDLGASSRVGRALKKLGWSRYRQGTDQRLHRYSRD